MRNDKVFSVFSVCLALSATCLFSAGAAGEIGATKIMPWADGAKACFLLMFDDSWPSHISVAVPELEKRHLPATYYICPGKGEYRVFKGAWETNLWRHGAVYGNHTMTHKGVADLADARREIGGCTEEILRIVPGKRPRLISWAMPGVEPGKWNISDNELAALLREYHLVDRPPFTGHGAVYHMQTAAQMLALADKAIASGGMEYVIFHGLEIKDPKRGYQDFWAMKQDIVFPFFDAIAARRDRGDLWVTDHISCHKYVTERDSAKIESLEVSPREIHFKIFCKADPQLYDAPLTLETAVPPDWRAVRVRQGATLQTVKPAGGVVRYHAVPGNEPVVLAPEGKAVFPETH
jgi:hypothetical protein